MSEWWSVVDDEGRLVARLRAQPPELPRERWRDIEQVELFAHPSADGGGLRLWLPTIRDDSRLDWSAGSGARLAGERRVRFDSLRSLEMRLDVRAPLLTSPLELEFERFGVDAEGRLRCELDVRRFDFDGGSAPTTLEALLDGTWTSNANVDAPTPFLFRLDSLVQRAPDGAQSWRLRLTGDGPRRSPEIAYRVEPRAARSGWWRGNSPTSPFSPFGLAPLGSPGDRDDLVMRTSGLEGSQAIWQLDVHWHGAEADGREVVSPVTIWNQQIAEPYHCALHTSKARRAASTVPVFEDRAEGLGTWTLRYHFTDSRPHDDSLREQHFTVSVQELICTETADERQSAIEAQLRSFVDEEGQPIRRRVRLQPVDTVLPDFRDDEGLRKVSNDARRDGYTGKIAIHPNQVAIINEAFTPSDEEVAHAKAVVKLFEENPDAGTLSLDGKMLDKPHLTQAQRVIATAERLQGR